MANNNKQFIFVKDMPFGESTIKQNTRLTYYNGYFTLDGILITPSSQKKFLNLIEEEAKNPNYLKEVKV